MSLARFRLITFDVTDTLIRLRSAPGKQYGELGAYFGIRCDTDDLAINFKSNWSKMNRAHPNFGRYSNLGWQNWWRELVAKTFRDSGLKTSNDDMIKFSDELIEWYKTSAAWQVKYGATEFLNYLKIQQQLRAKGKNNELPLKLGVISNFDPRLDILLRNMKIDHFFDFIINSYDCRCEKPNPEIFHMAMKTSELQDLKPNECLHIGDTPITDYLGARNCGWFAALVHEKDPDFLIKKYGEKIMYYHCFSSLFDLHKKMVNDFISW
ncbi:rhythmically expressed gene 2 protein [Condylostylus longicornis]|uniref:rhythmically expressed gene 2 protein n=1 Tax=Condylostylus longicornis TaxID=2530218 RepID=UPI00244E2BD7|nr:rhythmically expressed gene 2 protein [Condylostylus longicornis]XP_055376911.1 rhythmically expressed gene 2 protein [Condylostylus longicornis]